MVVLVSFVSFIIIELPPGDFLTQKLAELEARGDRSAEQRIDEYRARYGLDKPIITRYWIWITHFIQGDFGESFEYQVAASDLSDVARWTLNNTLQFRIDNNGVITNRTTLQIDQYGLRVTAYDPYDNQLSATFTLFVEPPTTTGPTTTEPPPPIPGFPITAIVLGLVMTIGLLIFYRRRLKS